MPANQEPSVQDVIQDLMQQRWVTDLFAELGQRQAKSTQLIDKLRAVDAGAHVFWPFQAVPFPILVTEAGGARILHADGGAVPGCHQRYSADRERGRVGKRGGFGGWRII